MSDSRHASSSVTKAGEHGSLPGFCATAWMFWMQPVLLREKLRECGIEDPAVGLLSLRRLGPENRATRAYASGLVLVFAIALLGFFVALGGLKSYPNQSDFAQKTAISSMFVLGFSLAAGRWSKALTSLLSFVSVFLSCLFMTFVVAITMAVSSVWFYFLTGTLNFGLSTAGNVLVSLLGVAAIFIVLDASRGIAAFVGLTVGICTGIALQNLNVELVLTNPYFARAVSIAVGFGVSFGVSTRSARLASGIHFGIATGLVIALFVVMTHVDTGRGDALKYALQYWFVVSVFATVVMLRIPIYFLEVVTIAFAPAIARLFHVSPLAVLPVMFHDLSYLPLLGLREQILQNGNENGKAVRRVLEACKRSPGQSRIGQEVLAVLKTREIRQYFQSREFTRAAELQGQWLAGPHDEDSRLQRLAETSRYLRAADVAIVAWNRLQQIEQARKGRNSAASGWCQHFFRDLITCPGVRRPPAGKHACSNDMFSISAWRL